MITRCPGCGAWLFVRAGHQPDPCTACQVWAVLNRRSIGADQHMSHDLNRWDA